MRGRGARCGQVCCAPRQLPSPPPPQPADHLLRPQATTDLLRPQRAHIRLRLHISKKELLKAIRRCSAWLSSPRAIFAIRHADRNPDGFVDDSEIEGLIHFAIRPEGAGLQDHHADAAAAAGSSVLHQVDDDGVMELRRAPSGARLEKGEAEPAKPRFCGSASPKQLQSPYFPGPRAGATCGAPPFNLYGKASYEAGAGAV
jgi:hypothetical protein